MPSEDSAPPVGSALGRICVRLQKVEEPLIGDKQSTLIPNHAFERFWAARWLGDASRAGRCGTPRERLPGVRSEATQSISREQPKPNTWSRVIVFPTSTNLCECFPSAATGRRLGIQRDANTRCELAFYHLACKAIQQIRSIVRHARVGASRTCRDASSGPRRQTGRVDRGLAF